MTTTTPNTEAPSRPSRRINVLASLRRHRKLAAIVFLTMTLLGLPYSIMKGKSKYYAESVVYISPRFVKNLEDDKEFELQSNSQYREFVQQNIRTVNRYDIVGEALARLGDKKWAWQKKGESDRKAIERLQGALQIRPVADTYQFTIGLESDKKENLSDIVNTLADVFVEKSHGEQFYDADQRLANLDAERKRLMEHLDQNTAEKTRISQALGVSSFSEGYPNPYDRLLVDARSALAGAAQKRIEADALLGSLKRANAVKAYGQDLAAKDASIVSLEANLNTRKSQIMQSISGLAPNHPGRKAAEAELASIDKVLEKHGEELTQRYISNLIVQKEAEAYSARTTEQKLKAQVDAQAAQASWFSSNFQRASALNAEIDHDRKRLQEVESRRSFLTLESNAPGFARIFSRALPAETPVSGGRRRLLLMFMFGGTVLGIILPTLADMMDPRIHDDRDVTRALGFEPMAVLLGNDVAASGSQKAREQWNRMAASVEREYRRNGSKTFLFTPVAPMGAALEIAEGLATELRKLALTVKVLDAAAPEFTSREGAPHALEAVPALRAELAASAQQHDIVLLVGASILESASTESLVQSVDVTVLVAEAQSAERSHLTHAASLLERCHPKAVACVLTAAWVEPDTVRAVAPVIRPRWMAPWLWS